MHSMEYRKSSMPFRCLLLTCRTQTVSQSQQAEMHLGSHSSHEGSKRCKSALVEAKFVAGQIGRILLDSSSHCCREPAWARKPLRFLDFCAPRSIALRALCVTRTTDADRLEAVLDQHQPQQKLLLSSAAIQAS